MLRITDMRLGLEEDHATLIKRVGRKLRVPNEDVKEVKLYKRSVDARKKDDIHFRVTVDAVVSQEKKVLARQKGRDVFPTPKEEYTLPKGEWAGEYPPVVVGFGPGGIFAALILAQMGLCPIVLERGEDIDARKITVENFWAGKGLNPESNVQFGEGGAGTFSDGKLTTRIKDLRCRKVLEELVEAGAPKEILFDNKPHIGTDKLREVVKNIRQKIESLGGKIYFNSKVTDIILEKSGIQGVVVNGEKEIKSQHVFFALGHSARDTFAMLYEKGLAMEQKPFAMGVRIEHLQEMVNVAQYGKEIKALGAADYKLTYQAQNGRGVYTFCMCPGGYVVGAASEEGHLAVNGMSEHKRDGKNANSALLVQVYPEDYPSKHPLAGITFQRQLEEKAFLLGGGNYTAPAQKLGDFLEKKAGDLVGAVAPTHRPNLLPVNLWELLPDYVAEAIVEAIPVFGKRLVGFDAADAILTGVESRSSSPVRILRNPVGESQSIKGVYPVGEGAGYAGGIISAAVDGIRAAESLFGVN